MGEIVEEILDIVDRNDVVIDQQPRSEVYRLGMYQFRVVNAFLINSAGELWIPRRSPNKRLFPSALDTSMGGHVSAGESYDMAFFRELAEELALDARVIPYEYLGSLNPYDHGTSAFMRVYAIHTDVAPEYNREDFVEYYWLKPEVLLDRLAAGEPSKGDLPKIVRALFV